MDKIETTFRIITALSMALFLCAAGGKKEAFAAMPSARRIVLPNQLVVLVSEDHSLPFVTFNLLVDAGSWRDPAGKEGLANLTAEAVVLGTSERSLSRMNEELDFIGADLNSSCGRDFATLSLKTLKRTMEKGVDLFLETLTRPAFPVDEVRRARQLVLGRIRSEKDDPGEVAEKAFNRALFSDSPYGHAVEGTEESLSALGEIDWTGFYRTFYRPNNAILSVVGDLTLEEVESRIIPRLEAWTEKEITGKTFEVAFPQEPETVKIQRPISQANIILGHGGIKRTHPDYHAVSVMNHILGGGGLGSRLLESIRVQRGLAYSVSSAFAAGKRTGAFRIQLQTKNASAGEAVSLALKEMRRIRHEPVAEVELETAKKYLMGSFPLRFVTQDARSAFFAQAEYYGLGLDYGERYPKVIGAVTQQEVLEAARTYLHPDRAILCVVGDLREVKGIE